MTWITGGRAGRLPLLRTASLACLLLFAGSLWLASRASAAELMLWDNYSASPGTVSFASPNGSGGSILNSAGAEIEDSEGLAYDTVTNRVYVPNSGGPVTSTGQMTVLSLDGSPPSQLTAPGATFASPEGAVIDPTTRTIYWINTEGTETIGWARLDGSAGGTLNVAGASLKRAYRLGIDPVAGRIYWGDEPEVGGKTVPGIFFANTNGSGGGQLNLTGASAPESIGGLAVDPAAGRIYWLNEKLAAVSYANLNGTGGGGDIPLTGATFNSTYGLALDPNLGRFYWANYGNGEKALNAIGTGLLTGGGSGITPLVAQVDGPQDPIIIKTPAPAGAPAITKAAHSAALACSTGTWGADLPGQAVYRAPRSYAYQWTLNGVPIAGANAAAYTAGAAGSYGCTVSAINEAGTTAQASAAVSVAKGALRLSLKTRKAHAKAGKAAVVKIALTNGGDLATKPGKACAKLTKKAKKGLKAPKCKSVRAIAPGASSVVSLRVRTKATAHGVYKFQVKVPSSAKPLTAQIKVTAAKKKHHKH